VGRVIEQAGGIAYRVEKGTPAFLLVTAKRNPDHWIFPKGHIEDGETAGETALRETIEEAGVTGNLIGPVGTPLEYEWSGRDYRVRYFLIRATGEEDSKEKRQKAWLTAKEAFSRLSFDDLRELLREARAAMQDR
jgi:bis(5'-nucleosidyl)-tetraphosphatase